jgi:DNA-binding LytR/AlgR family response regulator
MKPLKILIAEDLKTTDLTLRHQLTGLGFDVIDQVDTARKLIEVLEQRRVDLVLTNLFLGTEHGGTELAQIIMSQYQTAILVYTTEAMLKNEDIFINMPGVTLLLKPANQLELKVNIEASILNFNSIFRKNIIKPDDLFSHYIFVRADYKLNRIRVMDIYFVEAKKDYVTINTSDNVYTVHSTMRDIMNALPDSHFIRIHRSYIVNIDRIFSIKYPDLIIENKMKVLPVGGLYRKDLFDRLNII